MANISSNNLTSLYGGNQDTVITTTVVPNVAGTIPSRNLTTLYSGSGAPVTATTPYGNANVERFLNIGTDGGNTVTNIIATGNVTADYFIGNLVGNITGNANFANYAGNLINGTSNVNTNGSGGNITISVGGVSNVATFANSIINLNYPIVTPNTITIGNNAGNSSYGNTRSDINIGSNAGIGVKAGVSTIAIGEKAGNLNQQQGAVAIGYEAGLQQLGDAAIALGYRAGRINQGSFSLAIGSDAGNANQGAAAVAIGGSAGSGNQSQNAVAIGALAGQGAQGLNSVAIGRNAGKDTQGANSVAIGFEAGNYFQPNNSIILNATGSTLNQTTANTFTVKPVRQSNTANVMFYNNTTGEITYDLPNNITVANANFANFAGNVTNSAQPNITSLGTLVNVSATGNITSVSGVFVGNGAGLTNINGANITGNVANANYSAYAGNVTINAQPNITSLGTLTGLSSNGTVDFANAANVNLGSNSNVHIGGGAANYALITDGAGNLSWGQVANALVANFANYAGNLINGNSNVNTNGSGGNISISVGGIANVATFANNSVNLNYPINTPNNVFIGNNAGNRTVTQDGIISIGINAGSGNQSGTALPGGSPTIAIGMDAGNFYQEQGAIAIGHRAGNNQYNGAIAIGEVAGGTTGSYSISIGYGSGASGGISGDQTIAIGTSAGGGQIENAIAIGSLAGASFQGGNSIAIGHRAGESNQANNSIVLNATGSTLNQTTANTFTVKPVRNAYTANVLYYDNTTGEITYDVAISPSNVANANYANFAGNALTLANGTSNISIPSANGTIAFSVNNIANLVLLENAGLVNAFPTSSTVNMMRINTFGNPLSDAHRVAWARARGSNTSPTSVNPSDNLGVLSFFGHNGTSYQTNSVGFVRARVDAGYTANGANIPIGMQIIVNDTNGGINNQTKTHNFYANGNVTFANSVFVTDSLSVTGNITGGNITVGNITGILANGTSNISIPSANGTIAFSVNNTANLMLLENGGLVNAFPTSSVVNMLRINTFGNPLGDSHRIAYARARGSNTSPTSVNPNDSIGTLSFFGHNGTSYQTGSVGFVRARVDASYTANGANIPIGMQLVVNDTNGGVNNQNKTHNFYSNGTVNFANNISVSGNGNISGTNISVTGQVNGNTASISTQLLVGGNGSTASQVFITGDKTLNSAFRITGSPFTSIMDNVNPTSGYSPFFFNTYENSNTFIPPSRYFRAKGTEASPAAVTANDVVQLSSYAVYADSGNTYKDVFNTSVVVTSNDGAGNVAGDYIIQGFNANSRLSILPNTIANNISINSNNFMKLSFYTAANLTAITGQVGWVAAVSDSASGGGGGPDGMIAFWDTTNSRWSYIHNNSSV